MFNFFYCHRRYSTLSEPCQIRSENLKDALSLYQFYRDVQDELTWIEEKLPVASSQELGDNLTAVQNLQKKHQVAPLCCVGEHNVAAVLVAMGL